MGAVAGSGPHTDPCGSLGGLGAAVSPEAWQRPGAWAERARAVGASASAGARLQQRG